jgi:hypothetical protein
VITVMPAIGAGVGTPSSFVPIVPCRLADTRAGSDNVGTRATPVPANAPVTFTVHGTNGNCTIPATASGIATNVTAVGPTGSSFLTLYPADAATRPITSNLNFAPGSPPTPNQVTVGLSTDGKINVYNLSGTVDVIIDIVGYYQAAGGAGGTNTIPSGTTVTGQNIWDHIVVEGEDIDTMYLDLNGTSPVPLTDAMLRFQGGSVGQDDPACTGNLGAPTAPPGKVCIYVVGSGFDVGSLSAGIAPLVNRGFFVRWRAEAATLTDLNSWVMVTWAYTAP